MTLEQRTKNEYKIWFTSDTHFQHNNILKYCPNRKFKTITEHDNYCIDKWNENIKNNDIVFHLGDFALGYINTTFTLLERLNGRKILIAGNHDRRNIQNTRFRNYFELISSGYHEVEVMYEGIKKSLILCHYPIESWNGIRYGTFHLHGHQHTVLKEHKGVFLPRRKDIGIDSKMDLSPWEKNSLLKEMST